MASFILAGLAVLGLESQVSTTESTPAEPGPPDLSQCVGRVLSAITGPLPSHVSSCWLVQVEFMTSWLASNGLYVQWRRVRLPIPW